MNWNPHGIKQVDQKYHGNGRSLDESKLTARSPVSLQFLRKPKLHLDCLTEAPLVDDDVFDFFLEVLNLLLSKNILLFTNKLNLFGNRNQKSELIICKNIQVIYSLSSACKRLTIAFYIFYLKLKKKKKEN